MRLRKVQKSPKSSLRPATAAFANKPNLVAIHADDIAGLKSFAQKQDLDLTFVGPEVPLSQGIVDAFREGSDGYCRTNRRSGTFGIQQEFREAILQNQQYPDRCLCRVRDTSRSLPRSG